MSNIPLKCPSCGEGTFVIEGQTQPSSYEELVGAACQRCGRKLSEKDIKAAAIKIATEAAKKALGKFK